MEATDPYLQDKFVANGHPNNVKPVERTLAFHDLQWCLRLCPAPVLELLKKRPASLFVAGGFIRACIANEPRSDIDLFVGSKAAAENVAHLLAGDCRVTNTDNAYTVKYHGLPIQIIHRWTFDTPQAMLDSFDFTIAKACFWYDGGWKSLVHERFYQDLAGKRLIYTSPARNEDAGGSMLRVLKFYGRGYRILLDSLGAVIARLANGLPMPVGAGVCIHKEQAISEAVTTLLREVDPAVDPEHLAYLPPEEMGAA